MARPVLVVGLMDRGQDADWVTLLNGRSVVARSEVVASRIVPARWAIQCAYDDHFERGQLAGVEAIIAEDLAGRAKKDDIAYIVPGPGWIGDATVAALSELTDVEFAPAAVDGSLPAHALVTDALSLAQAEEREPFDSGTAPIDATVPTIVLNWHGQRVIDLATARLRSLYGVSELPRPNQISLLRVPARDALDGPPSFAALESITARLRRPGGCPWDREQSHESLLADFASEVEEYAEAVRSGDWPHAAEELGDVLLNVLMQAQIGAEAGHFRIEDVLTSINAKLVRRHPHVFAGVEATSPDDVLAVWNSVKQQEKSSKASQQQTAKP